MGPILPGPLVDFLAALKPDGRGCNGSSGGGGGSSSVRKGSGGDGGKGSGGNGGHVASKTSKVGVYGGGSRVRVYYNAHIPALSLWNNKNLRTLLMDTVLPTLYGHVLCKMWHLCGVCWKYCERKNIYAPTPPGGGNCHC